MRLKLVSPKDTLIGHVDVPDHWREWFKRSGAASAELCNPLQYREAAKATPPFQTVIEHVTLVKAEWSQYEDAVYLLHGTVEQLEAIPGVSFAPSMAYLRSQLP